MRVGTPASIIAGVIWIAGAPTAEAVVCSSDIVVTFVKYISAYRW